MSLHKLISSCAIVLPRSALHKAGISVTPSVRALHVCVVRRGEHRSPTEHPESTFGKDSHQTGISHSKYEQPHADLTNSGGGVLILPEEQLPSDYPETAEEWIRSARKYGIPIEEYQPYPDDGMTSRGDYPDFQPVHGLSRDFWHDWDMPPTKSDWGHVLHYDELDLVAFTDDQITPTVVPKWKNYLRLFAYMLGAAVLITYSTLYLPYHGIMAPRTYPHGWDPRKRRFIAENERPLYRFPEHPQHYNKISS